MNKPILALALVLAPMAALADEDPNWPDRPFPVVVKVVNKQIFVPETVAPTDDTQGGMVWVLTAKNYRFPNNGIVIEGLLTGTPPSPIKTPNWQPCEKIDDHVFRCGKVQHVPGRYKYTVNVIDSNSQLLTPLDPVILNH
jgi:hypothetical protein